MHAFKERKSFTPYVLILYVNSNIFCKTANINLVYRIKEITLTREPKYLFIECGRMFRTKKVLKLDLESHNVPHEDVNGLRGT